MFNPFRRETPKCPGCQRPAQIRRGRCAFCNVRVYIPRAYFRLIWLLVVVVLVATGAATYSRGHTGTWLLALLLSAIPLRIVFGFLIPPWFELGSIKYGLPFVLWYVAICVSNFLYWQIWGWSSLALVGKADARETMDFFSLPLIWISPSFYINSSRSFADVCGILFGNAFFYALATFVVYRVVNARLNRSRAIRLGISDADSEDEP
jgi:hypothetical protein